MTLAPLEIQKKEFRRSFRGYNEEEVKSFLEKVSADYEKIYKQNQDLKEEIDQLQEKLQEYKNMESMLKDALILAQKTAEDTKKGALKEKDIILKEALAKAGRLIDRAEQRYMALNNQYEELRRQFSLFKTRFSNFLQSQVEIVNSCELNDTREDKYIFDSLTQAAAACDEDIKKEQESDAAVSDDMNDADNIGKTAEVDESYTDSADGSDTGIESGEKPDDEAAREILEEDVPKDSQPE